MCMCVVKLMIDIYSQGVIFITMNVNTFVIQIARRFACLSLLFISTSTLEIYGKKLKPSKVIIRVQSFSKCYLKDCLIFIEVQ